MFKPIIYKIVPSVTRLFKRSCYVYGCPGFIGIPACYWSLLPNGVRVISEQTCSPVANISLFIEAGPRFETACNNGITHFIEHMAYKGFLSMPKLTLETSLQNIGAKMTVQTTREVQIFSATCLTEHTPIIINYLSRIMHELELNYDEIQMEYATINQELYDTDKDDVAVLFDYLHQTAFQGTPLSKPVIGPSHNYNRFDGCYTRSYLCEHYQPYRMVLAASGCFAHQDIVCQAQKTFSCIEQTSCEQDYGPCRFTGSEIVYRNDAMPFTHLAFALEAPGYGGIEYWKLKIMQYIVGKWHRSQGGGRIAWPKLGHALSVSQLAEYYDTFYIAYRDVGLWGVHICVATGTDIEDALWNIQNEFKYLCTMVQITDVERAVNALKVDLARAVDGSINSCYDMGFQILYLNTRQNLLEIYEIIESVKAAEIKDLANKYIYDRCLAQAALGATETLPEYNRVRSGMWWVRY